MWGLRKIRAGVYEHTATGRLIVKLEATYDGPRGGLPTVWEHASWRTLRDAAADLDPDPV